MRREGEGEGRLISKTKQTVSRVNIEVRQGRLEVKLRYDENG